MLALPSILATSLADRYQQLLRVLREGQERPLTLLESLQHWSLSAEPFLNVICPAFENFFVLWRKANGADDDAQRERLCEFRDGVPLT